MNKTKTLFSKISLSDFNSNLARLLFFVGGLLVFVGVFGLIISQQLLSRTTNYRSKAINPSGQVMVRWSVNQENIKINQNVVFTGYINTNNVRTDGVQLVMLLPKISAKNPRLLLNQNIGLQAVLNRVDDLGENYEIKLVALPTNLGEPFITTSEVAFATIQATSNQVGSYQLIADQNRCLATKFGSDPVLDELGPISTIPFNIISLSPTTTSTPPQLNPTQTPTPALSNNPDQLTFSFSIQGLTIPSQEVEGIVYLDSSPSLIDSQLSNQISELIELPTKFVSSRNGVIISNISLKGIPISSMGNNINVFVKTNTSLRKKLGSVVVKPGSNVAPSDWSSITLQVGDFKQTPRSEWNVINIVDITDILAVYTQLQVPTNSNNRIYDLNFDRVIDITDIAILLSNYNQLALQGD